MLWSVASLPYWLPMMAGYSRLIRADEEGSIMALKACRDATNPIGERYGGCMVGTAGDGVLWEFPSVTAAEKASSRRPEPALRSAMGVCVNTTKQGGRHD